MTDRAVTIAVWIALVVVSLGVGVLGRARLGRFVPAGTFGRWALRPLAMRAVVLVGWMWLGWHVFAR